MSSLVIKAQQFAEKHFANITENNPERTPYIFHLAKVADLVEKSGGNANEIAAAWLHDIVEDTLVTLEMIKIEFNNEVANIVEALTDSADYKNLTVQEKKHLQAERLKSQSLSAKRVKLADQISAVEIDSVNTLLTKEHRLAYCQGAATIAHICKGISPYLDEEFQKALSKALNYLNSL